MCTIPAIRILVSVISWFKAIFLIYTFGVGCFLASSITLQQAFGVQFISYGVSLVFIALLGFGILYPFKYGVDRHNRFVLAFVFCMETVIFAEMINYGLVLQSYTYPAFSSSLQLDCLQNTPLVYSTDECSAFYNHDRTAGFRLVWTYYFSQANDRFNFQQLSILQGGDCCGFFPPMKCRENTDSFPSNRETSGISGSLLSQRVTCSDYPNYYPEQFNCADVVDFSTNPPTVGGCRYDLGVSFCLESDIDPDSKGCAVFMENYVVGLISPHAPLFMGLSGFSLIYMLLCCCMWWKRKETDVFPRFIDNDEEAKDKKAEEGKTVAAKETVKPTPAVTPTPQPGQESKEADKAIAKAKIDKPKPKKMIAIRDVVYKEVRDPFVVEPRPRILVDEGFIPPDAHDLEMGSVGIHANRRASVAPTAAQKEETKEEDKDEEGSGSGSGSGSGNDGSDSGSGDDDDEEDDGDDEEEGDSSDKDSDKS